MKRIFALYMALTLVCGVSEARKASGVVTSGKERLAGVIVTDGKNFTSTDRKGRFSFDIEDNAEFVYIVTPSGYAADWSSGVPVPQEWDIDGVSLFPEINGEQPLEKELTLVHFNPLWPTTAFPKASRYAMDDKYAYFWDGRIYEYKTDPEFRNPLMYADASDEIKKIVEPLKSRVEEVDFYPDMPGQPRRSPYSTFYDFAPPQNPF